MRRLNTARGIMISLLLATLFWTVVAALLTATMALVGCQEPPSRAVVVRRCPVCGDLLVDDGYCTSCNLWFEIAGPVGF